MIQRLSHIGKQGWIAITIARDKTTYFCSMGQRGDGCQQGPPLEVASLKIASQGKEMIPIPNGIKAKILGVTNSVSIGLVAGMLLAQLDTNTDGTTSARWCHSSIS